MDKKQWLAAGPDSSASSTREEEELKLRLTEPEEQTSTF